MVIIFDVIFSHKFISALICSEIAIHLIYEIHSIWFFWTQILQQIQQNGDGFLNFTQIRREHSGWYKCTSRHLNIQYSSIGYYLNIRCKFNWLRFITISYLFIYPLVMQNIQLYTLYAHTHRVVFISYDIIKCIRGYLFGEKSTKGNLYKISWTCPFNLPLFNLWII